MTIINRKHDSIDTSEGTCNIYAIKYKANQILKLRNMNLTQPSFVAITKI